MANEFPLIVEALEGAEPMEPYSHYAHLAHRSEHWVSTTGYALIGDSSAFADALYSDFGLQPILVGGRSEREVHAEHVIMERARHKPVSALGSGLRNLVGILDGSSLVLAPDTGPLHMAVAARLAGWSRAPFLVPPLAAVACVVLFWLIARELRLPRSFALAGCALLAFFPTFVFEALQPMSDVPAAAWALAAIFAAYRARARGVGWAALAGAAYGVGVLVRPTNALLLAPLLFALPARPKTWLGFLAGPQETVWLATDQVEADTANGESVRYCEAPTGAGIDADRGQLWIGGRLSDDAPAHRLQRTLHSGRKPAPRMTSAGAQCGAGATRAGR